MNEASLTNDYIEMSILSFLKINLDALFKSFGVDVDTNIFKRRPDSRNENTVFPVLVASFSSKLTSPVGLGQIGHGGKRQVHQDYILMLGAIGKTGSQAQQIEDALEKLFALNYFIPLHAFTNGQKSGILSYARIRALKSEFFQGDVAAPGNDVVMSSYHVSLHKTIN